MTIITTLILSRYNLYIVHMNRLLIITLLASFIIGCAPKETSNENKQDPIFDITPQVDSFFSELKYYPLIKDTNKFISELRQQYDLEIDYNRTQKENEEITTYEKVKIYGSDQEFIFIEYDYKDGCGAAFPYKYQLILTPEGKLVKKMFAQRYEFIEIFENENPFLLAVVGTSKGNGGHEVYKISSDTLEQIFNPDQNYIVRTFDAHQDNYVNEPTELILKIKDYNKDGFNDLVFDGKVLMIMVLSETGVWYDGENINGETVTYSIDSPFKVIPVEYVFLYDSLTGHFSTRENYKEKYNLVD